MAHEFGVMAFLHNITRRTHFVAAVPPVLRVARSSVGYRSSSYQGRYVRARWPSRRDHQDTGPGNCVRTYAARYVRSHWLALIRVPRRLALTHQSFAASPRSSARRVSDFPTAVSLDREASRAARRMPTLIPSDHTGGVERDTQP